MNEEVWMKEESGATAPVKEEGEGTAYQPGPYEADQLGLVPYHPWYERVVRWLSRWAWQKHIDLVVGQIQTFRRERDHYKWSASLTKQQILLLEELFREKQAKITRLQECYRDKRRPMYEDMRGEMMLRTVAAVQQQMVALEAVHEKIRARGGKPPQFNNGTVQGQPGDRPNEEYGSGW